MQHKRTHAIKQWRFPKNFLLGPNRWTYRLQRVRWEDIRGDRTDDKCEHYPLAHLCAVDWSLSQCLWLAITDMRYITMATRWDFFQKDQRGEWIEQEFGRFTCTAYDEVYTKTNQWKTKKESGRKWMGPFFECNKVDLKNVLARDDRKQACSSSAHYTAYPGGSKIWFGSLIKVNTSLEVNLRSVYRSKARQIRLEICNETKNPISCDKTLTECVEVSGYPDV